MNNNNKFSGETRFLQSLLVFWTKNRAVWRHSGTKQEKAELLTQLSAAYYDISEVGFAKFNSLAAKKPLWLAFLAGILWSITWLPLALWCRLRMSSISDDIILFCATEEYLSARQLEVRQRILRLRGRYVEAQFCIFTALNKKEVVDPVTKGLLHVGQADCCLRLGGTDWQGAAAGSLVQAVNLCPEESDNPEFGRLNRDLSLALLNIYSKVNDEAQRILDTLPQE